MNNGRLVGACSLQLSTRQRAATSNLSVIGRRSRSSVLILNIKFLKFVLHFLLVHVALHGIYSRYEYKIRGLESCTCLIQYIANEYVILTVVWRPVVNTFVHVSGGMLATAKLLVYLFF